LQFIKCAQPLLQRVVAERRKWYFWQERKKNWILIPVHVLLLVLTAERKGEESRFVALAGCFVGRWCAMFNRLIF